MHGPLGSPLPKQGLQHEPTEALAAPVWIHGHSRDVQLIGHQPATGQSRQRPLLAMAQAQAPWIIELLAPLGRAPELIERAGVQLEAGLQITGTEKLSKPLRVVCHKRASQACLRLCAVQLWARAAHRIRR